MASDPSMEIVTYRCDRVRTLDSGRHQRDASEYVEMTLEHAQGQDTGLVKARIHIAAASKDMTFKECARTLKDGSNFSDWFASECRGLGSHDATPYTIEPFLVGAYAGISPLVSQDGYAMREVLTKIGASLGTGTPERTFVIYANRKPLYEFFCFERKTAAGQQ
ncbi:hypothetical protein SAMN05660284_02511 [Formivibrio citricus]|uniref:Uncharacterized protein n=2 Tax=Formivibrio citricus TaxID=83765 RepID=A0A1I5CW16_9NEIS|nr:hypothetical protein SAMN05660284_02511 [Formivibrio citricus]